MPWTRIIAAAVIVVTAAAGAAALAGEGWSAADQARLRSLALSSLPPLPDDSSNRYAGDPAAAALGKALFFDTRLSSNGKVACATCHDPAKHFQDGLALAKGVGETGRRAMPIAGTAYSPWLFWDGRKDSLWSQALGPLESPVEHGGDRTQYARLIVEQYADAYRGVFGSLPDLAGVPEHAAPKGTAPVVAAWEAMPDAGREAVNVVFANIGKAIAAYERGIGFTESRFDAYAAAVAAGTATGDILSADEVAGLRLFLGKGNCVTCHNGPLLTDGYFHNTGVVAAAGKPPDQGRAPAMAQARDDPFSCTGRYSDARPADCGELRFMVTDDPAMLRAFKTPSLRSVAERGPYMDAGQLVSLAAVIDHYTKAPAAPFGKSELKPVRFTATEKAQLEAFLRALSSEVAVRPIPILAR